MQESLTLEAQYTVCILGERGRGRERAGGGWLLDDQTLGTFTNHASVA